MNLDIARKNLSAPDPASIIAAVQFIEKSGSLADLQSILALLKNANQNVKIAAIASTSNIIRENLTANWPQLNPQVREKLGALLNSLNPAVVDELSRDLYSEDEDRKLRAVQIMGLLKKNPRVKELLQKLIQDRNEKIRATVVNILGRIVTFEDKDFILQLLNDKDKRVRANTIEALECLKNDRLVPILLRFRKDPNNRIRGNVIKALHTLGYTDLKEDLMQMINAGDHFMKASALWVISMTKFFAPELEDSAGFFLMSENEMVVANARKALQALGTPRSNGFLRYLDAASVAK